MCDGGVEYSPIGCRAHYSRYRNSEASLKERGETQQLTCPPSLIQPFIVLCSCPMEAAVLNSAIIPEVDCNSNTVDAELEVKKLQQLVRTLEWQNELLRTRASSCSRSHVLPPSPWKMLAGTGGFCLPSPVPTLLCESSLGSSLEEPFDYFHSGDGAAEDGSEPSVLDELELLDFDSLCCSDESDETW